MNGRHGTVQSPGTGDVGSRTILVLPIMGHGHLTSFSFDVSSSLISKKGLALLSPDYHPLWSLKQNLVNVHESTLTTLMC